MWRDLLARSITSRRSPLIAAGVLCRSRAVWLRSSPISQKQRWNFCLSSILLQLSALSDITAWHHSARPIVQMWAVLTELSHSMFLSMDRSADGARAAPNECRPATDMSDSLPGHPFTCLSCRTGTGVTCSLWLDRCCQRALVAAASQPGESPSPLSDPCPPPLDLGSLHMTFEQASCVSAYLALSAHPLHFGCPLSQSLAHIGSYSAST